MADEVRAQLLAVGRIQSSHGLKGYLKVKSLSGETAHLLRLKQVQVGNRSRRRLFEVEHVRAASGSVLLKIAGVDDRTKAEEYRGQYLWVDRREASKLGEGEYYVADLQGCLLYQGRKPIGRVVAVPEGGGCEYLEVETPAGRNLIVPFTHHFVGRVDIEERRIELTEAYELP